MQIERSSGILLHPTSLPGPYGVGELGAEAYTFVDKLAQSGQSWWQILPLNPTDGSGSPYASSSAFAMNTALIPADEMHELGLLTAEELAELEDFAAGFSDDTYEVSQVLPYRIALFERAAGRFGQEHALFKDYEAFKAEQSWLDDFALFSALKDEHGGGSWTQWPEPIRRRESKALSEAKDRLQTAVYAKSVLQFLSARAWQNLRAYAAQKGVKLIGDIPIFVAFDSADVWANRKYFLVDSNGQAKDVAGVPPDYFSATGQKWGNPLYDWDALAKDGYSWWMARIAQALAAFDVVRIDHFRGFESFWATPAEAPTAETGEWRKGPGSAFFDAVESHFGDVPFIAEDLGIITEEVEALRDNHHLPGMKILQFAFDHNPDHPFLPHTYPEHCVAYTGTHDNDTTMGWYWGEGEDTRHQVRSYLSHPDDGIMKAMMESLSASKASLVVFPLQDIFELGTDARMNTPGTSDDNWGWRVTTDVLEQKDAWDALKELTEKHGR